MALTLLDSGSVPVWHSIQQQWVPCITGDYGCTGECLGGGNIVAASV